MEKVPCKECNVLILPSTAQENGGKCMPCARGIRKNLEEAKTRYRKQKEYDPFRELWLSLVKRVDDATEGFDSLTPDEKVYFAVSVLDGEVYNGGMHQFFTNSSGEFYEEAVEGLTVLKAMKSLELLREATTLLFADTHPPKDRAERWEKMRQYPDDQLAPDPEWVAELDQIDGQYCEDPDGLSERLARFAEATGLITPYLNSADGQ